MSIAERQAREQAEPRYRALLEIADSIASHRDTQALFHDLAQKLHRVVEFDFINVVLHDPARRTFKLFVLEALRPAHVDMDLELPADQTPTGWVLEHQQPLIVDDVEQDDRYPRVRTLLRENGVRSYCLLPLTTVQRKLGALGIGSVQPGVYREADLELLNRVAAQVAVAIDNALNFEKVETFREQLEHERDHLRMLLEINNALVSNLEMRELFPAIASCMRRVMKHEYTSLALYDAEADALRLHAVESASGVPRFSEGTVVPMGESVAGIAFTTRKPYLSQNADEENVVQRFPSEVTRKLVESGIKSACCVPLITRNRVLGTLNVASTRPKAFDERDADVLTQVANQIAIAIENAQAYTQIAELKNKLSEEKLYLEDELRTEYNFEEVIGESAALKRVLRQVEIVGPSDATVLILGETGTGKELVARALHNLSPRRERTLVKLNCAAIPTGLLESELFGHEKGAFTGAIERKVGRIELADRGTLFLDEVGDIPLELQPKLLRVLQEQEFERLGSTRTTRVDVRLIAATNRDLPAMVAQRQFRSDLFYRVNVFPIVIPPLRDRQEDIPLLVRYFAQKYARRMNKKIETIPSEALEAITRYPWPGNVRELENFIERAVILSPASALKVPLAELKGGAETLGSGKTLQAAERDHILAVLKDCDWVLAGPHGAASRLGMKRTTLQSKMKKLGIVRSR